MFYYKRKPDKREIKVQVSRIASFAVRSMNHQPKEAVSTSVFQKMPTDSVSFQARDNKITVTSEDFGAIKKAERATLYTITNKNGASVSVSNFGATITSIKVPNKDGSLIDVVQGYKSVTPYLEGKTGHPGGTIGPVASKTMHGQFSINGTQHQLECNKDGGKTSSHGASEGLDVKPWKASVLKDGVKFTYFKKDGEGGHPGNMTISATYRLDNHNNLHIEYSATPDKDTILNLTNHSYFNLDGAKNTKEDAVLSHIVHFPNSSKFTPANELSIPTGELASVVGTPLDFQEPKKLGDAIESDHEQLNLVSGGFDHNLCIDGYDGKSLVDVAVIKSNKTGIKLTVKTDLPGFQLYTANNLKSEFKGKDELKYQKRSALCIEPQFFPNAINTEGFEKPILKKGKEFKRKIVYSFSAE